MNVTNLSERQLTQIGFTKSKDDLPRIGACVLCYHRIFGITIGYYAGHQGCFIFPFVVGYNWATHWQYHN